MTLPFLILLIAAAVLPGLLIAAFIYLTDKHAPEPHRRLAVCFAWGCFSVVPAIFLEVFGAEFVGISHNMFETFIHAMIGVAAIEEMVKYVVLKLYVYNHDDFDEPLDGIVYAVMISMGFATIENILYVLHGGFGVAILRMLTAVPAHAAFAVLMGYFVGLAKFESNKKRRVWLLVAGFVAPTVSHGLYDFFLFQQNFPGLAVLALVVLVMSVVLSLQMLSWHAALSKKNQAKAETPE